MLIIAIDRCFFTILGKSRDFAYNNQYCKFKWDEHMPTESSPEVTQSQINPNRVSIGALTAIIISIGAIIICLHNFYIPKLIVRPDYGFYEFFEGKLRFVEGQAPF